MYPCKSCGTASRVRWTQGRKRARTCPKCFDYWHTWERDRLDKKTVEPLLVELEQLIAEDDDEMNQTLIKCLYAINRVRKEL